MKVPDEPLRTTGKKRHIQKGHRGCVGYFRNIAFQPMTVESDDTSKSPNGMGWSKWWYFCESRTSIRGGGSRGDRS